MNGAELADERRREHNGGGKRDGQDQPAAVKVSHGWRAFSHDCVTGAVPFVTFVPFVSFVRKKRPLARP